MEHRSLQNGACEPIAIIGMACRWPGDPESDRDIETPGELWEFLQARKDAYSDFPEKRLKLDSWYHPKPNRPGSVYTRGGCFLNGDVRQFDSTFFGINPTEASSLDPAQRKFLEVVYEAFESAGVPLDRLSGSKTGCFVGNFNYDHQLMQYRDTEYPEPYGITGGGIALLSNRVSYVFNLQGPSLTLDTACSSSMYALHLACSAIQSGECSAAVVGGSNLILTPECQVFSSALGAVSKSSRCHTFDSAADGYARADGIGALVLKSLFQAMRDGDPIRAVIRGTAINANGRTGGITHPDPDGQEKAIRRAYERAGNLDPALTAYVECHGTGTPVGDPLEVEALSRVFAPGRTDAAPLLIGSVKANMGHSEASSGIAGIMKTVASIERGVISPIQGLKQLNPNVNLHGGKLKIVEESTQWPVSPVQRASVNSFGYGGANAHTILESTSHLAPEHRGVFKNNATVVANGHLNGDAIGYTNGHSHTNGNSHTNGYANGHVNGSTNAQANGYSNGVNKRPFLLPFSAHNERTLKANIAAFQDIGCQWNPIDVAYTLSCHRSRFTHRAFAVLGQKPWSDAVDPKMIQVQKAAASQTPSLGFVFTGQGSQWPQMGLELMNTFPTYMKSIQDMDVVLQGLAEPPSWTLEELLCAPPETSQVHEAAVSQPVVTAVQIALVNLLASWNARPSAVVGHSSGEIAAAYAAGRLSAAEAIVSAYARGQAVSRNQKNGMMLAVGIGADAVVPYLSEFKCARIACHNSPQSVTVSGDVDDIQSLRSVLDAEGIFARPLHTGGNAYHSHHMKALGSWYEMTLNTMLHGLPHFTDSHGTHGVKTERVEFASSVTGEIYAARDLDAAYWRRNLESPVLFNQAASRLLTAKSPDLLVEIGPHSALQGPLRHIIQTLGDTKPPQYVPTIVRKQDSAENVLHTAGTLFARGYEVDLRRVNSVEVLGPDNQLCIARTGRQVVDLPRYQWQYNDNLLYFENRWTREWRLRSHPRHDILGSRPPGGNWNEPLWRNVLRTKDLPWLDHHKIGDDIVFPTAGYLCIAIEAATQMAEIRGIHASKIQRFALENVHIEKALIIPDDHHGIEVLINLRPSTGSDTGENRSYEFIVTSVTSSGDGDVFTQHASGKIELDIDKDAETLQPPDTKEQSHAQRHISSEAWYEAFSRVGLNYGTAFRSLSNIRSSSDQFIAESQINLQHTKSLMEHESRYFVHPIVIDSALQLAILAAHKGRATTCTLAYMPILLGHFDIWPAAAREASSAQWSASVNDIGSRGMSSNATLQAADGGKIVKAINLHFIASEQGTPANVADQHWSPLSRMVWKPDINQLTDSGLDILYPSTTSQSPTTVSELPALETLAFLQIAQFHSEYPGIFERGSSVPQLQRLLNWMLEKINLARKGRIPGAEIALQYTNAERASQIAKLESSLQESQGPETHLMCHMYRSLPAIFKAELTGIQAAVQNHYLDDLYAHMELFHAGNQSLSEIVSLISHANPKLNILEAGGGTGSATREVLPALRGQSKLYRGYNSFTFTDITPSFLATAQDDLKQYHGLEFGTFNMEIGIEEQGFKPEYDLVVASNVVHATTDISKTMKNIRRLLKPGGKVALFEIVQPRMFWTMILGTFSDFWKGDIDPAFGRNQGPFLTRDMWREVLVESGYSGLDIMFDNFAIHKDAAVIVGTARDERIHTSLSFPPTHGFTLVYRNESSAFAHAFRDYLSFHNIPVNLVPLTSVEEQRQKSVIFLVEIEQPLFPTINHEEWQGLQHLLLTSDSALWVSRGDLLGNVHPEYAMMSGLGCAIRAENPSLRLVLVDLDRDEFVSRDIHFETLHGLAKKVASPAYNGDVEFRLKSGIAHISRIDGDDALNESVRSKRSRKTTTASIPLDSLQSQRTSLVTDVPGDLKTVRFEEAEDISVVELQDTDVEVEVRALGVHGKELAKSTQESFNGGYAGVISRVGSAVRDLVPGSRVYGLASQVAGTFLCQNAALCQRVPGDLTFEDATALPVAFGAALYGLMDLANVTSGETILIQLDADGIGLAAYQIARVCGAKPYFVAGSTWDKRALLEKGYGVRESQIFVAEDKYISEKILDRTGYHKVDVMFSCEPMQNCWSAIADLGRVVQFRRTPNVKEQVNGFPTNAIFASYDLGSLTTGKAGKLSPTQSLMHRINTFLQEGLILPLPTHQSHVANSNEALVAFNQEGHTEQPVLSLDKRKDGAVQLRQSQFDIEFSGEASYLLVGCLGGLGRTFALWMARRGARHLIFLSRSDPADAQARAFTAELRTLGVDVQVIQGNVSNISDVRQAVKACGSWPLKGVVQAALNLHDSFFGDMSLQRFHLVTQPRVRGTLNLAEVLHDTPLDFFMIWSSLTTLVGSASQGNYMASNSFLDAFAQRSQHLRSPVVSLALGQILDVGIVSETPEYQKNLFQMGLHGNNEAEFLGFCEVALLQATADNGYLLAGVDPTTLLQKDAAYPVDDMTWARDTRFSRVLQSLQQLRSDEDQSGETLVANEGDDDHDSEPLVSRIHKRVARLLYVPADDVQVSRSINTYGIDSMVAAQLRNWLYAKFHANVSLLSLLSPAMTIERLAVEITSTTAA